MGCCQNKKFIRVEKYLSDLKRIVTPYHDPFYNWSILTLLHSGAKDELKLLKASAKTEKELDHYEALTIKYQHFRNKYSSYKRDIRIVH